MLPSTQAVPGTTGAPGTRGAPLALLAVLTFALGLLGVRGGMVWDDVWLLAPGTALERVSPLRALVDTSWLSFAPDRYYRPVVFWSHRLDLAVWGRAPAGHHLTNALLYTLATVLLGGLLVRAGLHPWATTTGMLLFLAHPCHVEAFAWISGRHDLLATVFGLLATLALTAPQAPPPAHHGGAGGGGSERAPAAATGDLGRGVVAAGLLLLALLSKEVALAFPIAWLLAARRARCTDRSQLSVQGDAALRLTCRPILVATLVALGAYVILRAGATGLARRYPYGWPSGPTEVLASTLVNVLVVGRMLATLVVGADHGPLAANAWTEELHLLGVDAGHLRPLIGLEMVFALVAVATALAYGVAAVRRGGLSALGVGLVAIPIALALNLTTADRAVSMADRYLFLPSAGLVCLVAVQIDARVRAATPQRALRMCIPLALLSVLWLTRVVDGIGRYRDSITFWANAAWMNPLSPKAHSDLGIWLMVAGDLDHAERELRTAWAIRPLTASLQGLIEIDVEKGRDGDALALARSPPAPVRIASRATFAALALAAARQGSLALSRQYLDRADLAAGSDPRTRAFAARALVEQVAHREHVP